VALQIVTSARPREKTEQLSNHKSKEPLSRQLPLPPVAQGLLQILDHVQMSKVRFCHCQRRRELTQGRLSQGQVASVRYVRLTPISTHTASLPATIAGQTLVKPWSKPLRKPASHCQGLPPRPLVARVLQRVLAHVQKSARLGFCQWQPEAKCSSQVAT
jgi:hypothetical protein